MCGFVFEVSGPGCSSVLQLIRGDPNIYPGSTSDESNSSCGQLPAGVWLISPSVAVTSLAQYPFHDVLLVIEH